MAATGLASDGPATFPPPTVPNGAIGRAAIDHQVPRVEARLLVEHAEVLYGEPFRAGVLLQISPGWHIYADDPGDFGRGTSLEWKIKEAEIGPVQWPPPHTYRDPGETPEAPPVITFVYRDQVLLFSEIRPLAQIDGPISLSARLEFIACNTICIPGEIELARSLLLGAAPAEKASDGAIAAIFDHYAAQQPKAPARAGSLGLASAFVLALLGGLLLNLMPCVLPVLAIKFFSLAQIATHGRGQAAAHGAVYTSGVLASMWLLGALVLAARSAGMAVGWGFQFQQPVFLVAITLLLLFFALNLFGVYEINPDTSRLAGFGASAHGLRRSFFDGFLAVALATPCSAPFLGTAVGFAFAGGAIDIFTIFSAIGLGLALPFALVSFVPGWSRLVPASGAWMQKLRFGLGLALIATLVWLLWILGRVVGPDSQGLVVALLACATLGSFMIGAMQRRHASRTGWVAIALVALLATAVSALPLDPQKPSTARPAFDDGSEAIASRPFDAGEIAQELREQRPVFAYFTADWCITCKVNERLVLRDEDVLRELELLGVAVFRGDWTQRDDMLRAELARLGKAGVPTYVVYSPARPDQPEVLPEILTTDVLLRSLRAATPEAAGRAL